MRLLCARRSRAALAAAAGLGALLAGIAPVTAAPGPASPGGLAAAAARHADAAGAGIVLANNESPTVITPTEFIK
jgi:hypothetical protein